jgi:ABC-type microcin C transport system duplicated ATPase subunit YejF
VTGGRSLLEVEDLRVHFPVRSGLLRRVVGHVKAVDGVSFAIPEGSTVGLVGESGSGKTTIGRAIARLVPITTGSVRYRGERISGLSRGAFMPWRRRIATIFQDPFNSLNPRMSLAEIIS